MKNPFPPRILRTFSPLFSGSQQDLPDGSSCVCNLFLLLFCCKAFRVFCLSGRAFDDDVRRCRAFFIYMVATWSSRLIWWLVPFSSGSILNYFFENFRPSVLCFRKSPRWDVRPSRFILSASYCSVPSLFLLLYFLEDFLNFIFWLFCRNPGSLKYGWIFLFWFFLNCFLLRQHVGPNTRTSFVAYL